MNELQSEKLWRTIKRLACRQGVKRAAVAYVTSDESVKFGAGDVLVTDASDGAIESGQTSAAVLEKAFKRGADIYSRPGLHAKVMLLDGTAVIGSANLSNSSVNSMIEAAWVTRQPRAVSMVGSMVEELAKRGNRVDEPFLSRIKGIKVAARRGPGPVSKRDESHIKLSKPRSWIINASPLRRDYPDEAAATSRGEKIAEKRLTNRSSDVTWIRWAGRSRFRTEAKRWDTVILIWHESSAGRPVVYRHAPILKKQEEPNCTRFYIEEFSDGQKTALSWRAFQKLIRQVGLSRRIGPSSVRLIEDSQSDTLSLLWGK